MRRGDVAVFSISAGLAVIVVAAVTYSLVALDHSPRSAVIESDGTRSSSFVVNAHGTCAGVTPDEYFGDAATLTDQARRILDPAFTEAQGRHLTLTAVHDRFDAEFGEGAGQRVGLSCRNVTGQGSVVYELHVSLPPVTELRTADATLSLKDLILKGPPLGPGCRHASVP